ncbi:hypothetical protein F442_06899 [Phytophthora nicotianae P10297]|uniref:Uncharacterized protein n=4 Tax=Phytophthora nicotianae TaxID=4792 RepID=V9FDP6_PHYNI|nr:hypothetical protein F443_06859 [Phytophthora nicotianae P1569]ETM48883.1 hypothetical protein L914_06645 [Phytophthora nicotianae]ETP46932.1 hypothetical protein F442_06899 [Phytophthora nicotianae P10297]
MTDGRRTSGHAEQKQPRIGLVYIGEISISRHRDLLTRKKSRVLDIKVYELSTEDRIHSFHSNLHDAM